MGLTLIVYETGVEAARYAARFNIKDENIFGVSLGCESELSCFVFSPQKEYRFNARVSYAGLSIIDSYWTIEPHFETATFIDKFRTIPL
mmetsp:Transcript_22414/g.19342  ORF Transcript_22414/g.19342 Transcript_22414/m.19342 type:complete len:89 (+) Transcript_22414:1479-1745(+)